MELNSKPKTTKLNATSSDPTTALGSDTKVLNSLNVPPPASPSDSSIPESPPACALDAHLARSREWMTPEMYAEADAIAAAHAANPKPLEMDPRGADPLGTGWAWAGGSVVESLQKNTDEK